MHLTIYSPLKTWLVWLLMVAFFFMLIFPQFSDYTARGELSEAIYLASEAKSDIFDFYKIHQRCPRSNAEVKDYPKQGKYVVDVSFAYIQGSDACYMVAEMANTSQVDRRVRGSKLALVLEPHSLWDMQVNCTTDIKQPIADCRQLKRGNIWTD